jgi:hypothetical protein
MDFCRQKNKLEKEKKEDEIKKKEKEKDETKQEYLPWHGRYSASGFKTGFLRVGEVHKLQREKEIDALRTR